MKVIVTSGNPVKINATRISFEKMFPDKKIEIESVLVPSQVRDNPIGDEEMLLGAHNRIQNAMNVDNSADYYVGIEGGTEDHKSSMIAYAWMVIKTPDGKVGEGKTGSFLLPSKACDLIKKGYELGDACDMIFGKENHKQKGGTISILTKDLITRTSFYEPALIFALIPFVNEDLF